MLISHVTDLLLLLDGFLRGSLLFDKLPLGLDFPPLAAFLVVAGHLCKHVLWALDACPHALAIWVDVSGEAAMRTCECQSTVIARSRAVAMIIFSRGIKMLPGNATVYKTHD